MLRAGREAGTGLGGQPVENEVEPAQEEVWPVAPVRAPETDGSAFTGKWGPAWTSWVAECVLRGHEPTTIAARVRDGHGVGVRAAIDAILASPILKGALRAAAPVRAFRDIVRLRQQLERQYATEVRDGPMSTEEFHTLCWTAHRPCVLRGVARNWPDWNIETLRRRFGEVRVQAMSGRESTGPEWWKRRSELDIELTFGELLDHALSDQGNELYAVARNGLQNRIPQLKAEVGTMPGIADPETAPHLWVGPAGTLTPLHHDQSGGWLIQRVGTKRVWMASPLETSLLRHADGLHNALDARDTEHPDVRAATWHVVRIEPGDAVFIPGGWWHQVLAETPSISVALNRFPWPNDLQWFSPGALGPVT